MVCRKGTSTHNTTARGAAAAASTRTTTTIAALGAAAAETTESTTNTTCAINHFTTSAAAISKKSWTSEAERGRRRQSPLPPDCRLLLDVAREPGRTDEARGAALPRLAADLHPGSLRLPAGRGRQPEAMGQRGPLLGRHNARARGQLSRGAVRPSPPAGQQSRRLVRGSARVGLVHVPEAAAPAAHRSSVRRSEGPGALSRRHRDHRARDRLDPGTDAGPRRRRRRRWLVQLRGERQRGGCSGQHHHHQEASIGLG
ncbi:unnamed protein product [Trichogramma brassicae]|uniref:Uncharacterized protein n=1 Tax=Trichogramma brassicae TaxID=86971 RepID=A0A6H5IIA7_9HYME|nr:unnamed protein product [Trichogramma brassicae]